MTFDSAAAPYYWLLEGCRVSGSALLLLSIPLLGSRVPQSATHRISGCPPEGICATSGRKALREIAQFYDANKEAIEGRFPDFRTFDFEAGELTSRNYTRAKLIDMVLYNRGEKIIALRDAQKKVKT